MNKLMIGIEKTGKVSEQEIFDYFTAKGLNKDDDFIFEGENKFEYFVVEKAHYIVFKEFNDIEFFTHNVIEYIRTLNEVDKIFVQEDDGSGRVDIEDVLFSGSASSFITFWDNIGEETN